MNITYTWPFQRTCESAPHYSRKSTPAETTISNVITQKYIVVGGLKRNNKTVNRRGVMCPEARHRIPGVAISPHPDTANLNRGSPTISALGFFVRLAFCNSSLIGFKYGLFSNGTAATLSDRFVLRVRLILHCAWA